MDRNNSYCMIMAQPDRSRDVAHSLQLPAFVVEINDNDVL